MMRLPTFHHRAFQRRLGALGIASEKGAALIEAAVTLPILLLLLMGATEFAMAAYGAIEVSNAANAGADYGTATQITAADTAGIRLAAGDDAGNIPLNPATVSRTYACSDGTGISGTPPAVTCSSGAAVETILTVNTQAVYSPPIHWPGLPARFTLTGQAVRKVLQ